MTFTRMENGSFKMISDYQYNNSGLPSVVSEREYRNGILVYENITQSYYDDKGRNIKTIVQNNDDTSVINVTYYDSIPKNRPVRAFKKAAYNQNETFINFYSAQRKERTLSFHNGHPLLEQENIFNDKYQLISKKSMTSDRTVKHQEMFAYDVRGKVTRHEELDNHNGKIVYIFENEMPVAEETWINGKLYSTVNYSYSSISNKNG